MIFKHNQHAAVIGCHRHADRTVLAAVRYEDGRIRTEAMVSGTGDPATVLNKLDGDLRHWPLATVLTVPGALHRSLDLPPAADNAAARRMIELRLATMFPLADTHMQWGFSRDPASGRAWVTLVSAAAMNQVPPMPSPFAPPVAAVCREMAVAACVLDHDPNISLLILTSSDVHAAVVVLARGELHSVEQADLDGDDVQRIGMLDETFSAALAGLSVEQRPQRLLALGPAAELAARAAGKWDLQSINLREASGEEDEAALLAGGAARAALQRHVPCVRFDNDTALRVQDRKKLRRRIILAAAWLIVALSALWLVDLRGAAALRGLELDSIVSSAQRASLDRDLAITGYLQTLGPTPLAVLDEIGQLTESIQLDDVRYEAGGEFRLRGTQNSSEAINKLVNALDKAKTLDSVRLVSQRQVDRDKIEFEIVAQLSPTFAAAFVEPSPEEKKNSQEDTSANTEEMKNPQENVSAKPASADREPPPPPSGNPPTDDAPGAQEADHE